MLWKIYLVEIIVFGLSALLIYRRRKNKETKAVKSFLKTIDVHPSCYKNNGKEGLYDEFRLRFRGLRFEKSHLLVQRIKGCQEYGKKKKETFRFLASITPRGKDFPIRLICNGRIGKNLYHTIKPEN